MYEQQERRDALNDRFLAFIENEARLLAAKLIKERANRQVWEDLGPPLKFFKSAKEKERFNSCVAGILHRLSYDLEVGR